MVPLGGSNHSQPFWSNRKLLLIYRLLQALKNPVFSIQDLLTPHQYPRSITTASWEAFRIFRTLTQLEDFGVKTTKLTLRPDYFLCVDNGGLGQVDSLDMPLEKVISSLGKYWNAHIDQEGRGNFIFMNGEPSENQRNDLVTPQFFELHLSLDPQALKQKWRGYLSAYEKGNLVHTKSVFGCTFMDRIMQTFLKVLQFRQGRQVQMALITGKQDEFLDEFRRKQHQEYQLWQSGIYDLPFWEHLFLLDTKRKLGIQELIVLPKEDWYHPAWLGLHQMTLAARMRVIIHEHQKPQSTINQEGQVKLVEVTKSDQGQFFAFVNQHYDNPIPFTRRHKSGELIYILAKEGYASFSTFRRVYEYVQSDRRFKLFARSGVDPTPLVTRNIDGYITPSQGVFFRLLDAFPRKS